jgi:hypothetical protein
VSEWFGKVSDWSIVEMMASPQTPLMSFHLPKLADRFLIERSNHTDEQKALATSIPAFDLI